MTGVLIGVDWGTTRLRAFLMDAGGKVLDMRESASGIATVRNGDFDAALGSVVGSWQDVASEAIPIVMCGMVGSRQGWREVRYRSCPAGLQDIASALEAVRTSVGSAWIAGGLMATDLFGRQDVMRGEETQILGVAPPKGRHVVAAPGTHSKWAIVNDGAVESFRTYMTGEMFSVLRRHSSLGWLDEDEPARQDEASFMAGVQTVLDDPDILHSLFTVRTRGLFSETHRPSLASYLSGVLIGGEVSAASRRFPAESITLIATPELAGLYRSALAAVGESAVRFVDAKDAAAHGLWQLWHLSGAIR